jgi:hypothetical protein
MFIICHNIFFSYTASTLDLGSILESFFAWASFSNSDSESNATTTKRSVATTAPVSPFSQAVATLLVISIICAAGIICFVCLWGLTYGFEFTYLDDMRNWPIFSPSWNLLRRKKTNLDDTQTTVVSHHLLTSTSTHHTPMSNVWETDDVTGPRELSNELELFTLTEFSSRETGDLFDTVVDEPPRICIPGMRGIRLSDSEPVLLQTLHEALHTEIQEDHPLIISDEDDTPLVIFDNDQSSESNQDDDAFRILLSPNPWDMEQDDDFLLSAHGPLSSNLSRPNEVKRTVESRVTLTPDAVFSVKPLDDASPSSAVTTPPTFIEDPCTPSSDLDQEKLGDRTDLSPRDVSETLPQPFESVTQEDVDLDSDYTAEVSRTDGPFSDTLVVNTALDGEDSSLSSVNVSQKTSLFHLSRKETEQSIQSSASASPHLANGTIFGHIESGAEPTLLPSPCRLDSQSSSPSSTSANSDICLSNDRPSCSTLVPQELSPETDASDDEDCESSEDPGSPALTASSAADPDSPLPPPSIRIEDMSASAKELLSIDTPSLDDPDYLPLPGSLPDVTRSPTSLLSATRPAWSVRAADAATLTLSPNAPVVELPTMELPSMYQEPKVIGAFPTSTEVSAPVVKKTNSRGGGKAYRSREPQLDLAFAMQLRPGLGTFFFFSENNFWFLYF